MKIQPQTFFVSPGFVGVRLGRWYFKARDLRSHPKLFSERNKRRYWTLLRVGWFEIGLRIDPR